MRNLETERLILRPFQSSDLDRFAELAADSDFMRFSLKGALTREEAIQLFKRITAARRVGKPSQFAVIVRSTGALIGFCGFFLQIVDETEELEIAYRLHPDFWSRGIATEAARAIRDHAFEGLGVERVISIIHPDNIGSRRVAEKNGLTVEKQTKFRDFSVLIYSLKRQAWEKSAAADAVG